MSFPPADPATSFVPEQAIAWQRFWSENHAKRWRNGSRGGLIAVKRDAGVAIPNRPRLNCRETILALERQINEGRQLSPVKETP